MGRFSLAGSLWFVALLALGFAAVREASDFWVGATYLVTLGLLCASVLGAVLERGRGGAWWLGFALFGWAYLLAPSVPGLAPSPSLPSDDLARRIFAASNPAPGPRRLDAPIGPIGPDGRPISPPGGRTRLSNQEYEKRWQGNSLRIGHWIFALIFARAGATASCVFTKGLPWRRKRTAEPAPIPPPAP